MHDFTLIASVVGESVIGHGIGGKISGSEDPLTLTPRIIGNSPRRVPTTSSIEVTYKLLVSYELLRYHGVHSRTFRRELIRGPSLVSHARRLSYKGSHPRLMETHPSATCRTLPELA